MKLNEAINMMSELVETHKEEIVDIINQRNLGSLTYASDIYDVEDVVYENLENKDFLTDIDNKVYEKEEYCYEPVSATVIIIAAAIAIVGGITVEQTIRKNRQLREKIFREGFRDRYLTKEQLAEVALINRELMQNKFLDSQAQFLQEEENYIQQQREKSREQALLIIVAGVLTIIFASKYLVK
tara:strand:+ start:93 stop:644 length:552 start_codon:yes stop_codon:yes gene_type:complete